MARDDLKFGSVNNKVMLPSGVERSHRRLFLA
jgi:hypothetical protein